MQTRRTLVFSMLFVLLGLSLMLGNPREVNAGTLTTAEWEAVAGYTDSYIQRQNVGTDDGEKGFLQTAAEYKALVDNDNNAGTGVPDGTVCGVGDDMANRPVLVDNLISTTSLVPGTSLRNSWNNSNATYGALTTSVVTALRNKVLAHREAGFSDDIAVY